MGIKIHLQHPQVIRRTKHVYQTQLTVRLSRNLGITGSNCRMAIANHFHIKSAKWHISTLFNKITL